MIRFIVIISFLLAYKASALLAPSPATARSETKRQIREYVRAQESMALNDRTLGEWVKALQSAADDSTLSFDPTTVAGMWQVIHAPHIAFLSSMFGRFSPIEYHLTKDSKMASCVKYCTNIGSSKGWLCTSGYYYTEDSSTNTGNVRIVWDKAWWNAEDRKRPTPPEQGIFPQSIQKLGEIGFIEPLSFFPIKYVDNEFCIFQFFGFTITAMKKPNPKPAIFVKE